MADKRAFATFDVGYLDNPKIAEVFDASCIAVCMHFASVLYCAQHLTDGFVALRAMQRKAGGTDHDTQLLIDSGLWHEPGHDCEWCPDVPTGKLYVHDYTEHNRTSDSVKGRSSIARDNAKAGWEKRRKEREKADANGNASRIANGNAKDDVSQCLDRQTDRQIKNTSSSTVKPSKEFDTFWAQYPRKVGKQAAIKAYTKALKLTTPDVVIAGVERLKREAREPQFIPHPATWLNEGRWDDEPAQPSQTLSPWSKEFHK